LVMMLGIFAVMAWFGSVIDNLFLTYLIGQYSSLFTCSFLSALSHFLGLFMSNVKCGFV